MKFTEVDEFATAEGLPSLPGQILNILDDLSRTSAMECLLDATSTEGENKGYRL